MRSRIKGRYAFLCLTLFGLGACSPPTQPEIVRKDCSHWEPQKPPINSSQLVENLGWVSDHADILSVEAELEIARKLEQLETSTRHQVVVATVESLHQVTIEDYARSLGIFWGVGRVDENDGVVLLVAPNERKVRIAVGCGLETTLTNQKANDIIQSDILPLFKIGNYEKGISVGVSQIAHIFENE